MASMRVHELAKEFDMTSKELLDKLNEMKIPAKSHASMLADAYVAKIRKNLEPEIKQRFEAAKLVPVVSSAEGPPAGQPEAVERDQPAQQQRQHDAAQHGDICHPQPEVDLRAVDLPRVVARKLGAVQIWLPEGMTEHRHRRHDRLNLQAPIRLPSQRRG